MNFDYPPGATPLDPDEIAGLKPKHISNHGQLNEWELANIVQAESWAFSRRHPDLPSIDFVCSLHKRMFGDTWRWAGKFRTTEKNIGIDPARISAALHDLCEDVKAQLEFQSYPMDEIAARFSHRLVSIHPFANGNGRLSRTIADLLLVRHGAERFTWGAGNLIEEGEVRQQYLVALRAADAKDYGPLLLFVRS
ncbi:MAG: mobile mystery protein B [Burkholderiales bacterium]|nr:mobile mystery protein B [Burkholderiales bacterium]